LKFELILRKKSHARVFAVFNDNLAAKQNLARRRENAIQVQRRNFGIIDIFLNPRTEVLARGQVCVWGKAIFVPRFLN
jgi:hypothetical protein